jgi:hypothetical protein
VVTGRDHRDDVAGFLALKRLESLLTIRRETSRCNGRETVLTWPTS